MRELAGTDAWDAWPNDGNIIVKGLFRYCRRELTTRWESGPHRSRLRYVPPSPGGVEPNTEKEKAFYDVSLTDTADNTSGSDVRLLSCPRYQAQVTKHLSAEGGTTIFPNQPIITMTSCYPTISVERALSSRPMGWILPTYRWWQKQKYASVGKSAIGAGQQFLLPRASELAIPIEVTI